MTLEVTVDIVPFGERVGRRPIFKVKIERVDHRAQRFNSEDDGVRDYTYQILEINDMIPKDQAGHVLVVGRGEIFGHKASDRALELVRRVLEEHVLFG